MVGRNVQCFEEEAGGYVTEGKKARGSEKERQVRSAAAAAAAVSSWTLIFFRARSSRIRLPRRASSVFTSGARDVAGERNGLLGLAPRGARVARLRARKPQRARR